MTQFRVLYRQFLFRMADIEALSAHAQGDVHKLLGQFAALLIFVSLVFAGVGLSLVLGHLQPEAALAFIVMDEHFLISTTMLVVGLFAVLCWDSTFPDRRDVLVLAPLPVRARTFFLAKIAAVATALALTIVLLHSLAGLVWPLAFAKQAQLVTVPALTFDPAQPPMRASQLKAVMDRDFLKAVMHRDLAPILRDNRLASLLASGMTIGVSVRGERSVVAYGIAQPDSIFEIGSISKTFTGLLLARMVAEGKARLDEPVRDLLPPGRVARPNGPEITLLDLATHHSSLPAALPLRASDAVPPDVDDLFRAFARHGARRWVERFEYSNFGVALLGQALAQRAGKPYPELLADQIATPLGLRDTVVDPRDDQLPRILDGHDRRGDVAPVERGAFAPAGGIRSTAGDLLTYLEAQLHPDRAPALASAIRLSQELRADAAPDTSLGLLWMYRRDSAIYSHGGVTRGFTAFVFFSPRQDYAGVVLLNQWAGADAIGAHVRQRLAGAPTISFETVEVPASRGILGFLRWFAAYWITMFAAGAFLFCCILGAQGIAAQLLPRPLFLRVSGALQLAAFLLFVCVYFLQPPFPTGDELIAIEGRRRLAMLPSYWFLGVFHQLNGSPHPALRPLAIRAWTALAIAVAATASAYYLAYVRTLRQIVESPDIVAAVRGLRWWPRAGGALSTAVFQFSARTLLRSRQHRIILAFYLGIAFAVTVLFLESPTAQQQLNATVPDVDPWRQPNAPMLAASIAIMALWAVGIRVVFALPLDLRANWVFRASPVEAGQPILVARRRSLVALSILPVWIGSAAVFLWLWPWRPAALHLVALALFGVVAAETCLRGPQKIPFTCSYLPGKSNFNTTLYLSIWLGIVALAFATQYELAAFDDPAKLLRLLIVLILAAAVARWRSSRSTDPEVAELRFEEIAESSIQRLGLEGAAGAPRRHSAGI